MIIDCLDTFENPPALSTLSAILGQFSTQGSKHMGPQKELESDGKFVKARSPKTLSEEMPEAYKDVDEVIRSLEVSGIAKKVARLTPIGVVKG